MRQVTKEEFFKGIGQLNVHPQIQNSNYPYSSLWVLQGSYSHPDKIIGKTVGVIPEGKALAITEYYLND